MALTNHILPDSPTNNFATLNPLNLRGATLYDGSLKISGGGNNTGSFATIPIQKTDKWYIEVRTNDTTTDTALFLKPSKYFSLSTQDEEETIAIFSYSTDISIRERTSPTSYTELGVVTGQSRTTTGDVLGYLFDLENNTITVYKNGVHKLTVTNVTPVDDVYFVGYNVDSTWGAVNMTFNFGQDPTFAGAESPTTTYTDAKGIGAFYYQPPTGALALCTANLPDFTPTVAGDVPQDYFKTITWAGSGNTGRSFPVGFQPDLVLAKNRGRNDDPTWVYDSVRGAGSDKHLATANHNAEGVGNQSSYDYLSSFDAVGSISNPNGGFSSTYAGGTYAAYFNDSNYTFVAWCWKAGGNSNTFNINGTGYSTYSALQTANTSLPASSTSGMTVPSGMSINTNAGFSIVKYAGTGSAATVPHGLSSAPDLRIIKGLDTGTDETQHWFVWSAHSGSNAEGRLDLANVFDLSASTMNGDSPVNSNTFPIGSNARNNQSGKNYIAYCWHSVEGYSKFGSYTGNGSADGPFVYCGFRPAFVMVKSSTVATNWYIFDSERGSKNPLTGVLFPNTSDAETFSTHDIDFVSNGFKVRQPAGYGGNNSNATYIFMAFAEQPFKFSNAR
jgi:hypothetical protein